MNLCPAFLTGLPMKKPMQNSMTEGPEKALYPVQTQNTASLADSS